MMMTVLRKYFLITEEADKSQTFEAEASKSAVINTYTETVAGENWFQNHTSNLLEKARKEITYLSIIKFGDGRRVQALRQVVFVIAEKHCKISSKIVAENKFLLSKSSLKKRRTVLNMNDDKAAIFDIEVILHQSTSGRYCIEILPLFFTNRDTVEVLVLEGDLFHKQKLRQIDKA